nr:GNAT family N-acetyltransferase [Clostridium chrysemydis]
MDTVLTSERLIFKRINKNDFKNISEMLKDPEVMYAWEKGFTSEEVERWIDKRLKGYEEFGYDYFLAIDKNTKKVVGQIGLLDEVVFGEHFTGLGYILKKEFWHKGYALEGANAMIEYAFSLLGKEKVIATIRPENEASLKVAKKLKMNLESEFIKVYKGKEMKHLVYSILK